MVIGVRMTEEHEKDSNYLHYRIFITEEVEKIARKVWYSEDRTNLDGYKDAFIAGFKEGIKLGNYQSVE